MNCVHICSSSIHQDSYLICWFWIHLCWVQNQWKQVIFSQIVQMTAEFIVSLQFIHQRSSQANLVIIMSACQVFDLDCWISTWSWNQIETYIQPIMFVDVSTALWSWSTADSCDSLESSQRTLILQVLIIIVQNIVLSQAVSYYRFHSLISQHSVFVRRRQLNVIYYSCHIARAHFLECDQINQFQEHIQNQNWNIQVLI